MGTGFGDQLHVFEASADNADNANEKPARVRVLAFVESKCLLIEVSEQVKRLHKEVSP